MPDTVLVGDIGGTNVRFGRARLGFAGHPEVGDIAVMPGDSFRTFHDALSMYLSQLGNKRPHQALFAFAGPVRDGVVQLTNRNWIVDSHDLVERTGLERIRLVNDYAAMARSIPELTDESFRLLHDGHVPDERSPILVAGPGTGLGMATLLPEGERGWRVMTGEGGHAAFAPRSEREWELTKRLKTVHGYVSKELVLSGSGLNAVHRALCDIDGIAWELTPPADIMRRAEAGDALCRDICEIRAGATLDALGDAALINGTRGGVVITGGVAERLVDWLAQPRALSRFFDRGPMSHYMEPIPIRLLMESEAALIGAAALHFDEDLAA
ncbi:MAG: glucokinase [Hyphomonas sp.]|jgi:glucokinase|nr:glucokinase [Henriciella sp.]MBO6695990.1 glucokinase [Henriciella sp.]MCH9752568.1 glucokinase [Alphaproteobacteria bacterium]MCR9223032.1 glucokinase [Hyphomonas sp.]